jgi:hypothetical protein
MAGALLAAAVAFAHARPEGGGLPHGFGGGGFGARIAAAPHGGGREGRDGRVGRAHAGRYGNPGGAPLRVAGPDVYRPGNGGNAPYPGAITPISTEARPVPHPPANSPVRAGSIREDVARYNEERSTYRPLPRQAEEGLRQPISSPYRN